MTTLEEAQKLLSQREEKGLKTYGTTLDNANLTELELLNHLKEEIADSLLYIISLIDKVKTLNSL